MRWSRGQVDYSRLSRLTEMSSVTVKSYVEALQIAHAIHLVRPFSGGGGGEIVRRPKCYAFDTGFVTFERGWNRIREDDRGLLWEHLVLDSLRFRHLDDHIYVVVPDTRQLYQIRRDGWPFTVCGTSGLPDWR